MQKPGQVRVRVDPRYFRPTEVEQLLSDPAKAKEKLGWEHTISFKELVEDMVSSDLKLVATQEQDRKQRHE